MTDYKHEVPSRHSLVNSVHSMQSHHTNKDNVRKQWVPLISISYVLPITLVYLSWRHCALLDHYYLIHAKMFMYIYRFSCYETTGKFAV